jgi:putative CRISPR-associated protein (TIGR02619 family)
MKTFLFVTVGISALGITRKRDDLAVLDKAVGEYKEEGPGPDKEAKGKMIFEPLLDLHRQFWSGRCSCPEPREYRRTSAELVTTCTLLQELGKQHVAVEKIVLLVSDTHEGKLAGTIVRSIMTTGYTVLPTMPPVEMETIPGMTGDRAVERFPNDLLRVVSNYRENETDRVIFNATAGFGGTLLLIGMMAVRYGFQVYYQFEKSATPLFITPGLRMDRSPWVI